jgi:hypothetical protein
MFFGELQLKDIHLGHIASYSKHGKNTSVGPSGILPAGTTAMSRRNVTAILFKTS